MLYNCRFDLARVLLEKESFQKKVEAIVGAEPSEPLDEETARLRKAFQQQQANLEQQRKEEQGEEMRRVLVLRQKELEERKAHAAELKKNLAERRANLAKARDITNRRNKKLQQEAQEEGERLKAQYDALHNKIVDTRAILCREVATLLRLTHSKKKTKDGKIKDRHYIAGSLMPDLKDINS
jgi:type IV secretory pathway VirB10-like protein